MTFESLQTANQEIKTTDIKGKDYAEVNQRIKAFRMLFPNGRIETEIVTIADGVCIMKASVYDEFGSLLGTGTAYEKESSTFINKTSYIENCETSAVGRALGMCGIGIDVSVASTEEVLNAIKQQSDNEKITKAHVNTLATCIPKHGQTVENVIRHYGVKTLDDLNMQQFNQLMKRMGEQ